MKLFRLHRHHFPETGGNCRLPRKIISKGPLSLKIIKIHDTCTEIIMKKITFLECTVIVLYIRTVKKSGTVVLGTNGAFNPWCIVFIFLVWSITVLTNGSLCDKVL